MFIYVERSALEQESFWWIRPPSYDDSRWRCGPNGKSIQALASWAGASGLDLQSRISVENEKLNVKQIRNSIQDWLTSRSEFVSVQSCKMSA